MRRLALLLLLCLAQTACPSAPETCEGGIARVGPAGALLVCPCGALDVPAGALAQEVQLTFTPTPQGLPAVEDHTAIGTGCRIASDPEVPFAKPVTVSLAYAEDRIPAKGIDPQDFRVRTQVGLEPAAVVDAPRTDTGLKVVSGSTRQLGLFWPTSPNDPLVGSFTVTPGSVGLRVGGTAQLTARVTDRTGAERKDIPLTWRVLPARVGRVDAAGLFTALAPGNARVVVKAGDVERSVQVAVQGDAQGPTSFLHANPFPTGNDLLGGTALADGALLAVGTNGTVLSRDAAGAWSRLASTPFAVLRGAAIAPDGSAVAVGSVATEGLLVTREAGAPRATERLLSSCVPQAVWYDGTHGMAVGTGNDVLVRRAGAWATEYSPSFETLLAVTGDGRGGFFTLGAQGSLFVYSPATATWDAIYEDQLAVLLTAAVLSPDASEAWAVGAGRLWHYRRDVTDPLDVGAWSSLPPPATPALDALTAVGVVAGKVVVGGVAGRRGYLLTYDPAAGAPPAGSPAWTVQPLTVPQVARAVVPVGTDGGYVLGDLGAVWQLEAGAPAWVERSRSAFYGDVLDVSQAPDGTLVAGVVDCKDADCTGLVGQVWLQPAGGGAWRDLQLTPAVPVRTVLARSATEVYAGTETGLFRWDGSGWATALPPGAAPSVRDVWACGSAVWATGLGGRTYRGASAPLSPLTPALPPADLFAGHCSEPGNDWLAGDEVLLEDLKPLDPGEARPAPWAAVYSPAPGEAFAFGLARYGVYWDTEALQTVRMPTGLEPRVILGLHGSSIDNLYAVGDVTLPVVHGVALRFDGAAWRLVDAGASRPVTSVTGRGERELWLGTRGGGVLRAVAP
jgi:hypothetical protein